MQAIILAGGFGTRLQSAIGDVPKPMADIGGEPFLAHYLRYLRAQGVSKAMLSVHHRGDVIQAYFKDHFEGLSVSYAEESKPLGTGGALKFALSKLEPKEPVLAVNGDSFIELDIAAMLSAHHEANARLTVALREMPDCSRYGEAKLEGQRIVQFAYPGRAVPGFISLGAYIISPNIFENYALPEAFSFEKDFQRPYAAEICMQAWLTNGYFIDIGQPEDYARAKAEWQNMMRYRFAT